MACDHRLDAAEQVDHLRLRQPDCLIPNDDLDVDKR